MQTASENTVLDTPKTVKGHLPVIERSDWQIALCFMLCCVLTGLHIYPAALGIVAMLFWAFRREPYHFVIMALLFTGGYGLMNEGVLRIKIADIALMASVGLFVVFRKPPIVRKTIWLWLAYFAVLFAISLKSDELLKIQFITMRHYLMFAFFIIPIVAFIRRPFRLIAFWDKLLPYCIIASVFYILDAFVLDGNILMPGLSKGNPWHITPLSGYITRNYPPGIYILAFLLYPLARGILSLPKWMWWILIIALLSTQTFSVIVAYGATFILFRGGFVQLCKYSLAGILVLVAAYFIDGFLPTRYTETGGYMSALRIKSSVDQFIDLMDYVDEEDLASFGSGRMAQVLPKVSLVTEEGRQLTGLGFLHSDLNTVKRYEITNELYVDASLSEEVAAEVEVVAVQIYINAGWIGLAAHMVFLFMLWWFIRRLPDNSFFLSIMFCCIIMGIGGFGSLVHTQGLCLLATAYSAIILYGRNRLPGFPPLDRV